MKLSLADRLPPLLMGAYREYQNASKQYIEEAFAKIDEGSKKEAIATFTERYLSHGYPIDRKICKDVGLNVVIPSDSLENNICDLHDIYQDLIIEVQRRSMTRRLERARMSPEEEMLSFIIEEGLLIVQGDSKKIIILDGQDITSEIETEPPNYEKKNNSARATVNSLIHLFSLFTAVPLKILLAGCSHMDLKQTEPMLP